MVVIRGTWSGGRGGGSRRLAGLLAGGLVGAGRETSLAAGLSARPAEVITDPGSRTAGSGSLFGVTGGGAGADAGGFAAADRASGIKGRGSLRGLTGGGAGADAGGFAAADRGSGIGDRGLIPGLAGGGGGPGGFAVLAAAGCGCVTGFAAGAVGCGRDGAPAAGPRFGAGVAVVAGARDGGAAAGPRFAAVVTGGRSAGA